MGKDEKREGRNEPSRELSISSASQVVVQQLQEDEKYPEEKGIPRRLMDLMNEWLYFYRQKDNR